ncbi:hypothetical protein ACHAWF_002466 [Thalassiosira exigua]
MELTRIKKDQDVYIKVWDLCETTYFDRTGVFPFCSYRGHRYLMVMVEIDSSYILVAPMKTKQATEMVEIYLSLLDRVKQVDINPKKHVLENEVSEMLQQAVQEECKLELVPPGFNSRMLMCQSRVSRHTSFIFPSPIRLWSELLSWVELTLNLLRPSHARPNISDFCELQSQSPI